MSAQRMTMLGEDQAERYASEYSGRRLKFKQGMSAIRAYEFELSRTLLDILAETPGVRAYGLTDTKLLAGSVCPPVRSL